MKVSTKMLLHIVIFNVIFAVTWAAAIPASANSPQERKPLSIKDTLCSENPTLNIRAVCPSISGTPIDSSDSTLKNFGNLCDHAVYLARSLCNYTQSDSKLGTDIANNVTALLSQNVPDDGEFCAALHKSQTDYWANMPESEIIKTRSCGDNCMLPTDMIKPLCRFVQWSWKFLFDRPKGSQEPGISQAPVESKAEKKYEVSQATANSSGNKPDGALLEPPGNGQEPEQVKPAKPEQVKPAKPVEAIKEEDQKNSPSKGQSTLAVAAIDSDQKDNPLAKEPNSGPRASEAPVPQLYRPSERGDEENLDIEKDIEKPQVKLDPLGKVQTSNPIDDKTNQELTKIDSDDENPSVAENPSVGDDLPAQNPQSPDQNPQSPDQKNRKELKAGLDIDMDAEGRGFNDDGGGDEADERREPIWPKSDGESKASESLTGTMDEYGEAEDSHFFVFFFIATFICIVFYLIYQNKRKIIAMALEGKKGRHTGRRRPTSASYQKLDNKLDEVMASSPPPSKTHVIY